MTNKYNNAFNHDFLKNSMFPKMRKVLGISAFFHDSAAAVVVDGEIIAAAQEERFTRKKNTEAFPVNAVKYCLEESGLSIDELDAIVFYDKPLLKFERLLETYYAFAPNGIRQFVVSMPVWLREKLFIKRRLSEGLNEVDTFDRRRLKILFPEHHLSHAASAFFPSPFEESAILTIDGVGEWATASIAHGTSNGIKLLKEMRFPHSVGLLYSSFTYFLGFKVNSGEYKLMGLAAYGNPKSDQTKKFIATIKEAIVSIHSDGSIGLNQKYFRYATGLTMINKRRWEKLFGVETMKPEGKIEQVHCNLAYAIQKVTEEIILKMAMEAKKLTGSDYLCLAGGVALNSVANGELLRQKLFKDIYIQPASGDAGGALGAALTAHYMYFDAERHVIGSTDSMKGSYLGPEFSDKESLMVFKKYKAPFFKYESFDELCVKAAGLLANGSTIGWFQGRMEFGPRALGNRSILADARNPEMHKKLNLKVKFREGFRPFAPSVLSEHCSKYFDLDRPSPYMLLVADLLVNRQLCLPNDYYDRDMWDRLYFHRSELPAITHVDFSARIQTVHRETNERYWKLLSAFEKLTGCAVLVNSSFNVRGEPIVCTPEDAYTCFMRTGLDFLIINNFILDKNDQYELIINQLSNEKFERD